MNVPPISVFPLPWVLGDGSESMGSVRRVTKKQGRHLAHVYWYSKVHRIPPSENEIAEFLGIPEPSARQMILTLEPKGALSR
jgi:hypothetical protein